MGDLNRQLNFPKVAYPTSQKLFDGCFRASKREKLTHSFPIRTRRSCRVDVDMNRLLAVDPLQIQDLCNDELRDGRHKLHEEHLDYLGLRQHTVE